MSLTLSRRLPSTGPLAPALRFVVVGLGALLLLFLFPLPAHACRYNVRDVGFVDLETVPYRLLVFVDHTTPPASLPVLTESTQQALADGNVTLEFVNPDDQPNHPAIAQRAAATGSSGSPPAAILVAPDGPTPPLALSLGSSTAGLPEPAALAAAVAGAIVSPLRETLVQQVSHAFGVILLIEGTDPAANAEARRTIAASIEQIRGHMKSLPKTIAQPPELLALEPAALARERVLLWSLRQDTTPTTEPRAAILYGRARWIGPLMRGAEISVRNLVGVFSLVGADCECGLDLAWTQGTRLPVRWPESLHAPLAAALGFDPDNPVVKTEISWIVSRRGSGEPGSRARADGSPDSPVGPLGPEPASGAAIAATPLVAATPIVPAPARPPTTPAIAGTAPPPLSWVLGILLIFAASGSLAIGAWVLWRANRKR